MLVLFHDKLGGRLLLISM